MTRRTLVLASLGVTVAAAGALGFTWPFAAPPRPLKLGGVVEVQEVGLGPKVAGRVGQVLVKEGAVVEPGQVLVMLDAPELGAQVRQAQARVRGATADLDKARNGPRPPEKATARADAEAARARWKKLVAGSREEEVRQARSDVACAGADVKQAEQNYFRVAHLGSEQAIAAADQEVARGDRDRARGKLASAQSKLDQLIHGSRPEEIAEAKAQMESAEAKYQLLLDGTRSEELAAFEAKLAEEQAKLEEMETQLAEHQIRAPERAVVNVVAVRKGDLVTAQQAVVRVLRTEDLWVKVFVPETELAKVRLNQDVTVTIDAYPGKPFAGRVATIATTSEFTPRNVQTFEERGHQVFAVKVVVPDPQGVFKAGLAAAVSIPLQEAP
jgi:multidrug resistance efflux pump